MKSVFSNRYAFFMQKLIHARKANKLTQVELAQALKKPQSYVSKYERGERRLDVVEFIDIAKQLNLDPAHTVYEISKEAD